MDASDLDECKHGRGWWCDDCEAERWVEAAVRATIAACAKEPLPFLQPRWMREMVEGHMRAIDPAPIVARVLGGEK